MPMVSDRKSTRLNSSHLVISYAVFCLKKKKKNKHMLHPHQPTQPAHATPDLHIWPSVYLECEVAPCCTLSYVSFFFVFFFFFFKEGGPPRIPPFSPPRPFPD